MQDNPERIPSMRKKTNDNGKKQNKRKQKNKNDLKFRRNTFLLFIPESAQKAQFNEIARAIHNFSSDKTFQRKRIWPLR